MYLLCISVLFKDAYSSSASIKHIGLWNDWRKMNWRGGQQRWPSLRLCARVCVEVLREIHETSFSVIGVGTVIRKQGRFGRCKS